MLSANPSRNCALVDPKRISSLGLSPKVIDQTLEYVFHHAAPYGNTRNHKYGDAHLQEYGRTHDNYPMEFKDRLKAARKYAKLTQVQLAERVGIDQTSVSDLERGKSRKTGYAAEIAHVLGVSARWLTTGEGEMLEPGTAPRSDASELVLHETEVVDGDEPLRDDEVEIPYFREVEMAAGDGRTQVIENHGAYMRFSLPRLMKAGVDPSLAACATVSGDSMEPVIVDGSPIGIDKGCRQILDGKVYALDHCGMLRVKRLYRLPPGRMRVVSDNHIEYPEEIYTLGDPDAPKIIGRVFWWETFA
ncbi:helix-turn-helix transcriptional regulator [Cobetia sp. SIMBA_158]|uniref:XRE family transcriptional regulator n=1 Tax=Cobetia sp. SIMBA_158 TaxID=3081617 RepID=UPI00397FD72B